MAGYNRVIMIGNLTRDPDHKQLSSGQSVCRLGLASNRQFKNRQTGDMVQEVCFVDVDVWGAQAESCRQYLQKGRSVLVEGRLKFDTWEDTAGQSRNKLSIVADRIVFLSSGQTDQVDTASFEKKATPAAQPSTVPANAAPVSPMEKELLDQIDQIKGRAKTKKPAAQPKEQAPAGGVDFKDSPPFQDDLPF